MVTDPSLRVHGSTAISPMHQAPSVDINEIPTTAPVLGPQSKESGKETSLTKKLNTTPLRSLLGDERLTDPAILSLPLLNFPKSK